MKYRHYSSNQALLLPPDISDLIPEDSPIWIIMEVVSPSLVKGLETSKSEEGNAAYNPLMMTRLLVFSYYCNITSSRQIQRKTYTDIEFIYLTGWQHPDFRTICKFRRENAEFLSELYKKVYRAALALGLINLGSISIDGTIIKADASGNKSKKVSKWKEIAESLDKKIKDYNENCATTDKAEDNKLGKGNNGGLPEDIRNAENRLRKIRHALKQIDREDAIADSKVSITDPDARFMKKSTGGSYTMGYRVGMAVDENQLIADIQMTNLQSDMPLLGECLNGVEETIGAPIPEGTKILADNGFSSAANTQLLEEKELDGYISQTGEFRALNTGKYKNRHDCPFFLKEDYYLKILGGRKRALNKISFAHSISLFPAFPINFFWNLVDFQLNIKFDYDEERDVMVCPMGRELRRDETVHTTNRKLCGRTKTVSNIYFRSELSCEGCPLKQKCAPGRIKHRVCKRPLGFESLDRMRKKMEKPESREVYVKRRSTVEPVFGDLKRNMGFHNFNIRGFLGKVELGLKALCHNVKKLFKMPGINNVTWNYSAA